MMGTAIMEQSYLALSCIYIVQMYGTARRKMLVFCYIDVSCEQQPTSPEQAQTERPLKPAELIKI